MSDTHRTNLLYCVLTEYVSSVKNLLLYSCEYCRRRWNFLVTHTLQRQLAKPSGFLFTQCLSLLLLLSDGKTGVQGHSPAAQRPGLGADAGRGAGEDGERGQIWGVHSQCHPDCRNVVKWVSWCSPCINKVRERPFLSRRSDLYRVCWPISNNEYQ